jgi:hypothetical protein
MKKTKSKTPVDIVEASAPEQYLLSIRSKTRLSEGIKRDIILVVSNMVQAYQEGRPAILGES